MRIYAVVNSVEYRHAVSGILLPGFCPNSNRMNFHVDRAFFSLEKRKLLRLLELFLILAIAVAPSLFSSISIFLTGYEYEAIIDPRSALLLWGRKIITNLAAIASVIYVLFRQGRKLSHIGFYFSKTDFPNSILLTVFAYLAIGLSWVVIYYIYYLATGHILSEPITKNIEFLKSGITAWSLLAMIINPFYEEIVVRAYTMSEIKYLTKNNILAIIFSVALQASCHLYQGNISVLLLAPIFLVYSFYYSKTQRIMPIILSHMYLDFIALICHSY